MPHDLHPALPGLTMPNQLASAFEEVLMLDAALEEYADGRSTRRAMAFNSRRGFRLSRPLNDAELDDLRGFYFAYARYGHAFWFYNYRETIPPGSWDESGADPIGRYTVVWEGSWTETIGKARHTTDFVLREVV